MFILVTMPFSKIVPNLVLVLLSDMSSYHYDFIKSKQATSSQDYIF